MKKYKKNYGFLIMALLFMLMFSFISEANERSSDKKGLDVIFVMDYSGSMKTNDPEQTAQGMVKAFIDTVHSADIRIGFVAYNDRLLSTTSPISVGTNEERQVLRQLIDAPGYSGNTDIGLGLRNAHELISQETNRKKAIVLISDGESDLKGSQTGRGLEQSLQDEEYVAQKCEEQGIPIYSIAFGTYDGNTANLESLSKRTQGQMYFVNEPSTLIEILYGIFADNMDYRIQQITDSIYAPGIQNIRFKLDDAYLDELDVLVISPQSIGPVRVLYGEQQVEAVNSKNYAVTKITDVRDDIEELTIQTETIENQKLQIYLVSYRNLTPVLDVESTIGKNLPLKYKVYFKDKTGAVISDEAFYKNFRCELRLYDGEQREKESLACEIRDGIIVGETSFDKSGIYYMEGQLDDRMGSASFKPFKIEVNNRLPMGNLPETGILTSISKQTEYVLTEFFSDPDGDVLSYSLRDTSGGCVEAKISEGRLLVDPVKSGNQSLILWISDGEGVLEYSYHITVTPLWKVYWWIILLFGMIAAGILWKVFHKPKPVLDQITEEKKRNHFCGKLDVYCTGHPDTIEEIPPLSFQMHKVKDNKITLGNLMGDYPEISDALGLDSLHLIADEDRRMILYHTSHAVVMIGNSIVCRQIQYSVSFGDVIYITSQDGAYELEMHYITVIQ